MASLLTTTTTLTVPRAALEAAENLRAAIYALNAADGVYAMGGSITEPYDLASAALLRTLEIMVNDHPQAGAVARYIADECISNGENVRYQITQVIGWALRLVDADGVEDVPASPSPYLPALHDFS